MPSNPKHAKKAITLRLPSQLVADFRAFCRDHAGKPLYLAPATFVEQAIAIHLAKLRREVGDEPAPSRSRSSENNTTRR